MREREKWWGVMGMSLLGTLLALPARSAPMPGPWTAPAGPMLRAAVDDAAIEAFLRRLYAGYSSAPGAQSPDPTGKGAAAIFEPGLLALIRREKATAPRDEVGLIDGDPICSCQDWDRLRVQKVTVTGRSDDRAEAAVAFVNSGATYTVRYTLVPVNGQWRVYDIASQETPSFRKMLSDGLAEREKSRGKRR